jgi:parvulin-like peptidyl-prolyl isomerase
VTLSLRSPSLVAPILVALGVSPLAAPALRASEANRIILRVNDRIATLYDYEQRRDERLRAIQTADLEPERRAELVASLGAEVMSNMLDELLVLSRADQIGYVPTEGEIAEAVARAKRGFGIQTDDQFQQALAASGMTVEVFEKQVATNLRVSQVMGREVQQRVELEEEDLRRIYYERPEEFTTPEGIKVREIVILDSSSLDAAGREALAARLRDALESGEPMQQLAEEYAAEGKTSAMVDLGWIERGDLDPALERAVWDLEPGGVSEPVAGRGGLHLLQLDERREERLLEFSEVADSINQAEHERLMMEEYEKYLGELREAAYIRVTQLPPDVKGFSIQESASRLTLETELPSAPSDDPDDATHDATGLGIDPEAAILEPPPDPDPDG